MRLYFAVVAVLISNALATLTAPVAFSNAGNGSDVVVSGLDLIEMPRPPYPPEAFLEGNHSGYCNVEFAVSRKGKPFDIKAAKCTHEILADTAVKSVKSWRFSPKTENGRAVEAKDLKNKVTFQLQDEQGNTLPNPPGF